MRNTVSLQDYHIFSCKPLKLMFITLLSVSCKFKLFQALVELSALFMLKSFESQQTINVKFSCKCWAKSCSDRKISLGYSMFNLWCSMHSCCFSAEASALYSVLFFNATVSAQSALSVLSNTVVLLFDSKYGHKTHKFVPVYHKYFEGIFSFLGNRRDDPYCSHVCEINM